MEQLNTMVKEHTAPQQGILISQRKLAELLGVTNTSIRYFLRSRYPNHDLSKGLNSVMIYETTVHYAYTSKHTTVKARAFLKEKYLMGLESNHRRDAVKSEVVEKTSPSTNKTIYSNGVTVVPKGFYTINQVRVLNNVGVNTYIPWVLKSRNYPTVSVPAGNEFRCAYHKGAWEEAYPDAKLPSNEESVVIGTVDP